MTSRKVLATAILNLCLCLTAVAQDTPTWTATDLAGLIGKDVPKSIAAMKDINPEDHFAVNIDVFRGTVNLPVGKETIPVTLEVFTRDLNVGAVRVVANQEPANPGAVYKALRDELLASRAAADGTPVLGADSSSWTFVNAGTAEVTRSNLTFTLVTTGMSDSYQEFWRNFNAGK